MPPNGRRGTKLRGACIRNAPEKRSDGRGTKPRGRQCHEQKGASIIWGLAAVRREGDAGRIRGRSGGNSVRGRHFHGLENPLRLFSRHGNIPVPSIVFRRQYPPRIRRKRRWHGTCFSRSDGVSFACAALSGDSFAPPVRPRGGKRESSEPTNLITQTINP